MTKCGQLVILNRKTLKRIESNISSFAATEVHSVNFDDLKSVNIATNHPLWLAGFLNFFLSVENCVCCISFQ